MRSTKIKLYPYLQIVIVLNLLLLIAEVANAQTRQRVRSNNKSFLHIPRNQQPSSDSNNCNQEEFRTIDGTCNNITHSSKSEWGASDIQLYREVPPQYSFPDPFNDLAGKNRPSPRAISNRISAQEEDMPSQNNLSSFVFTWGQFLDHDIDLTPEGHTEYEPISLPNNEPLFTYDIPFFRSAIHEGTGTDTPREQSNLITSWIDASNVYGSEGISSYLS